MFELLDKLAGLWLDWRTGSHIAQNSPDIALKKLEVHNQGVEATFISPAAAVLANELADMLDKNNAENYVQFDLQPRIDKGLKPIRVTIQWANGKSPAQRVKELEEKLAQ